MSTNKSYEYGDGGISLTSGSTKALDGMRIDLAAKIDQNPSNVPKGAAAKLYQFILDQISVVTTTTQTTDMGTFPVQIRSPLPNVDKAVYN